jgi:hypothetical protein
MREHGIVAFIQAAAQDRIRRGPLMTLAGAAVAAAVVSPSPAGATRNARRIRKRARKRKARRCKRQIDQCRSAIAAWCGNEPSCENNFDECCSMLKDCKAGSSVGCFFSQLG